MGKNCEYDKRRKMDYEEIEKWSRLLQINPDHFVSMSNTERNLRISELKSKLELNLAKGLISYQKEKLRSLLKRNANLQNALQEVNAHHEPFNGEEMEMDEYKMSQNRNTRKSAGGVADKLRAIIDRALHDLSSGDDDSSYPDYYKDFMFDSSDSDSEHLSGGTRKLIAGKNCPEDAAIDDVTDASIGLRGIQDYDFDDRENISPFEPNPMLSSTLQQPVDAKHIYGASFIQYGSEGDLSTQNFNLERRGDTLIATDIETHSTGRRPGGTAGAAYTVPPSRQGQSKSGSPNCNDCPEGYKQFIVCLEQSRSEIQCGGSREPTYVMCRKVRSDETVSGHPANAWRNNDQTTFQPECDDRGQANQTCNVLNQRFGSPLDPTSPFPPVEGTQMQCPPVQSAPVQCPPVQSPPVQCPPAQCPEVSQGRTQQRPAQQGRPQQCPPQQDRAPQGNAQKRCAQQCPLQQGRPKQGCPKQGRPKQGCPQQGRPKPGCQQNRPQQCPPQQSRRPQCPPQQSRPQQCPPEQSRAQRCPPQQGQAQQRCVQIGPVQIEQRCAPPGNAQQGRVPRVKKVVKQTCVRIPPCPEQAPQGGAAQRDCPAPGPSQRQQPQCPQPAERPNQRCPPNNQNPEGKARWK